MKKIFLAFTFLAAAAVVFAVGENTPNLSLYKGEYNEERWDLFTNENLDKIDSAVGAEHNANGSHKADVIDDTNIEWGTAATQVSADDIPDGSTNVIITSTQETNFGTAYTHSQNDADLSATNEIQDLSLTGDTLSLSSDVTTISLSAYYNSLSDLQGSVSNDFHNLGGTDATNDTVSGTELDGVFSTTGILKRTAAATYSAGASVDDLTDVVVSTPAVDQILRFNGSEWVNSSGVLASASQGIDFFFDDASIITIGTNNNNEVTTLLKTPSATAQVVDAWNCTNNTVLGEAYLYNMALDRTSIDAGIWTFNTYASVSSTLAGRISYLTRSIRRVRPESATITTTGTGTSRTATASGDTPFDVAKIDVGGTIISDSYLQTAQGLYRITARTSDTVVTIETPTTYTNETGSAFSVWKQLFSAAGTAITSTGTNYSLYTVLSSQQAFTIEIADKFGCIMFATSNNTTTVNFVHNGTTLNSHFQTPLITLHGNLSGLQGGSGSVPDEEYYHLTLAQHTVATQSSTTDRSGYLTDTDWDTFNGKEDNLETAAGNIGIGTTTTPQKLTVNGGLSVDGNTINLSDTTDEYVLAFDTGTQTWRGVVSTAFDSTTLDSLTWSDGTEAELVYTFSVVGTDTTLTFGSGVATFGDSLTVTDVLTTTNNIKSVPHHLIANIGSPALVQAVDTHVILWSKTPAALTVTNLEFTCDANPTTEPTGDVKYADSCIGFANATVINDFDTADGVRSDNSITSGSVAAGKCIYLEYDAAPDAATTQHALDITWDYD